MKGKFKTKKAAKDYIKVLEKSDSKFKHCYFYFDKQSDGSFNLKYSDPGEGEGW